MNVRSAYFIETSSEANRTAAIRWLWLSIVSLAGAGVFSILLVLARTPAIGESLPFVDFFHSALVVHVDLSVLVWIMAFAGVLWSLVARTGYAPVDQGVFLLICLATGLMVTGVFLPDARPVMSNYIPVLDNALFLSGLSLFGLGIGLQVVLAMSVTSPVGLAVSQPGVLRFGLNCAAVSLLMAVGAFAWSWLTLPVGFTADVYYEYLFWGGGHVLQFTYTLLMMVCWLWLASLAGIRLVMTERVLLLVFTAGLVSVFLAPLIYLEYHVTEPGHRQMFTWLMSFGGSLATFPLGLALYFGLIQHRPTDAVERFAHSALMLSLLLFACGGVIGFIIDGDNVTVPAHYHGCIVGVTLALMGVAYEVIRYLGFRRLNLRAANLQLWIYAVGQFLHILGLVWSGGYGVARKTAGSAQGLDSLERIAGMGLMGFGGLLSAVGGFLFVVIAVRALLNRGAREVGQETVLQGMTR